MRRTIIILIALAGCGPAGKESSGVQSLNVTEFNDQISEETILLDVRTPQEFQEGYITGAVNLDYKSPDFEARLDSLDKSKTYLVYCAAGVRSSKASEMMILKGFTAVSNLAGGLDAWIAEGRPVQKN